MQHNALQLPVPTALPSTWHLAGAAALALALLVSFINALFSIPAQLQASVDALLLTQSTDGVVSEVHGRDVSLSGTVDASVARDSLVQNIRTIAGVRVVRDDMRESDPAEQSQLEAIAFRGEISKLPVSEVAFEPGSSNLTETSKPVLDELAGLLDSYPGMRIRIGGHTDNTGRRSVNLRISRERAQRVADYLTQAGTEAGRIVAQGYGDTQPIADNATDRGRAANRRIGISFID